MRREVNKIKKVISFIILFTALYSKAQNQMIVLTEKSSDYALSQKINLSDSLLLKVQSQIKGIGKHQDITSKSLIKNNIIEHNSFWIELMPSDCGELAFEISSSNLSEKIDFILFKKADDGSIFPIRYNYSKPEMKKLSSGLSPVTVSENCSIHSNETFCKTIPIKAGETYYLMLDCPKPIENKDLLIAFHIYKFHSVFIKTFDYNKKFLIYPDVDVFEDDLQWYSSSFGIYPYFKLNLEDFLSNKTFGYAKLSKQGYFPYYISKNDILCGINDTILIFRKIMKDSLFIMENIIKKPANPEYGMSLRTYTEFFKKHPKVKIELLGVYNDSIHEIVYLESALKEIKKQFTDYGVYDYRIFLNQKKEIPKNHPPTMKPHSLLIRIME